jgi:hypothetical protein
MVEKKQFVKRVRKKNFFLLFYGGFWLISGLFLWENFSIMEYEHGNE